MADTEADTCRKAVTPKLYAAGWTDDQISEQRSFTDGRIVVTGNNVRRRKGKRADYLLRYKAEFPLAIVEAKAKYRSAADGLQQAKDYAEILDLKFAYATNGQEIIEFDYFTGREQTLTVFPSPSVLWDRWRRGANVADDTVAERLLSPFCPLTHKGRRYYQVIAINRVVQAILQGRRRILLTMATGTGKTATALHICWKLWNARWNRTDEYRKPKILYLADRNILVDDPKAREFAAFGEAATKIEGGKVVKSREIYFAIYQALAKDERRPGLYKEFPPDFFDLIIVDECHRGSARDDSNWREILEYFEPAYQLGMTATPKREENSDTYSYFGDPVYTYTLRQGIEDGFLAPYRVHRIVTSWDAAGWRPTKEDIDRYGRAIPDEVFGTKDFERVIALKARTEAIARHITDFLKKTDRMSKTIVFCVDQEHASEMRQALTILNEDMVRKYPNYVCRVTADEGDVGRGHLSSFQDLEKEQPVILTTSQLLTTGVDAPTCKNIVLARVVGAMTEFKQIIGRGTRLCDDYGKLYFNILDYVGSTRLFADPAFDGDPVRITEEKIDDEGQPQGEEEVVEENQPESDEPDQEPGEVDLSEKPETERRKLYFDGGWVDIDTHLVSDLDPDGALLRVVKYTDYTAEKVRTLYRNAADLRQQWSDPSQRGTVIESLADRGIDFDELTTATDQPDADPLDLLCYLAFNAPLRTRRERAERLRKEKTDFFDRFGPEAREVLDVLLDKYTEHGTAQFVLPQVLEVPPLSERGNLVELAARFGGADELREAVRELQTLLYAA